MKPEEIKSGIKLILYLILFWAFAQTIIHFSLLILGHFTLLLSALPDGIIAFKEIGSSNPATFLVLISLWIYFLSGAVDVAIKIFIKLFDKIKEELEESDFGNVLIKAITNPPKKKKSKRKTK